MTSYALDVRSQYADGEPILFWKNRINPFRIGSQTVAQSGKVAIVQTQVSGLKGAPMVVEYRLARRTHIEAWIAMIENDPFNTTSLTATFITGHTVIFSMKDPFPDPVNEVIRDYDFNQEIFDYTKGSYRKGFDLWRGFMNLIIIT